MMNHIDLSSVLRQTVACDLYSNLVTRPTGAAVRTQIERLLDDARERTLTVIDFSQVSMIDFSCADEVVAKLLMRYSADDSPQDAYFLFRGVNDDHRDAIESVLQRHGLAMALEQDDGVSLIGVLSDLERRAWNTAYERGPMSAVDIAMAIGAGSDETRDALDELVRRRLVMRIEDQYIAIGSARA